MQSIAQSFSPDIAFAYRLATKLKVDSARTIANQPRSGDDWAQAQITLTMADLVENLVIERNEQPAGLEERFESRIEQLEKSETVWGRHALAETKLAYGMIEARYGENFSAFKKIRSAYHLERDLLKEAPDFLPAIKAMGVYNTILGLATRQYKWTMKMLGLAGDYKTGLEQLRRAATQPNAQQRDAQLLLAVFETGMEEKPDEGLRLLAAYTGAEADDVLGLTAQAFQLMRAGRNEEALSIIRTYRKDTGQLPYYYPLLIEGQLWLQRLQYDKARALLEKYLEVCSEKRFVKDLHYQLFLAEYLYGNESMANQHYYAITTQGNTGSDGDRFALYFAKRGIIPNKMLLRARLLFDGGFYDRALTTLDSIRPIELRTNMEQTEYIYRRARIEHKQGKLPEAQRHYEGVLAIAGLDPSYFAPMSCLQLGDMSVKQNELAKAADYYQRAERYPEHEYKESLDYRAGRALKRVRKKMKQAGR